MKKGDRVIIADNSFSRSVINGKLIHENFIKNSGHYVIVETDCKFPEAGLLQSLTPASFNNTVIQEIKTGKVVFIEEQLLKPAKHQIVVDGKTIEISHESFENLKLSLAC